MTNKSVRNSTNDKPIEKHETAAWADIEKTKPVSKVTIPCEFNIENAKDYVEENQK